MISYEEEIKNKLRIEGKIEMVTDLIKHGGIPLEIIIKAANLPESIIKKILDDTQNN